MQNTGDRWGYMGLLIWLVKASKEWQASQGICGSSTIVVGALKTADTRCIVKELDSDPSPLESRWV